MRLRLGLGMPGGMGAGGGGGLADSSSVLLADYDYAVDGTSTEPISATDVSGYAFLVGSSYAATGGSDLPYWEFGSDASTFYDTSGDWEEHLDYHSDASYGTNAVGVRAGLGTTPTGDIVSMMFGLEQSVPAFTNGSYLHDGVFTGQLNYSFTGNGSTVSDTTALDHIRVQSPTSPTAGTLQLLGIKGTVVGSGYYDIGASGTTTWPLGSEIDLTDCDMIVWGYEGTDGTLAYWEFGDGSNWYTTSGDWYRVSDSDSSTVTDTSTDQGMIGPYGGGASAGSGNGWFTGFSLATPTFGGTQVVTNGPAGVRYTSRFVGGGSTVDDATVMTRCRMTGSGLTTGTVWFVKLNLGLSVVGSKDFDTDGAGTAIIDEFALAPYQMLITLGAGTDGGAGLLKYSDGTYREGANDWDVSIDPSISGTDSYHSSEVSPLISYGGVHSAGDVMSFHFGANLDGFQTFYIAYTGTNGNYAEARTGFFTGDTSGVSDTVAFTHAKAEAASNVTKGQVYIIGSNVA